MLRLKELEELKTKIQTHENYYPSATPQYDEWRKELDQDTQAEARVRKCFEDPDTWVGVFENHDLGHSEIGRRIAFPFAMAQFEVGEIGKTRAPDTRKLLGWRYILIAKCRTGDEAMVWLRYGEKELSNPQISKVT